MKLENIKVAARLRESPAALFKVNKLTLSEDEKSINISSLNDMNRNNSKQGHFEKCFGKFAQNSEVAKGMECSKYLKQLLHGYNAAILSLGVGESDVPGSRSGFLIENLDNLERLMEQNAYRFDYSLAYTIFGVSDGHCVNLKNYKKCDSLEISAFLQDYEMMEPIDDLEEVRGVIAKGYSLPLLCFIHLRTESKNELDKTAANVAVLCLTDLGSLSNPGLEKSISTLKSLILTMDQTFVSGELRFRDTPLTHLLSPFLGGNAHTLVLMEILTNSSFAAVSDAFLVAESLRKVKNRVEQVFENCLVDEVDDLWEQNQQLAREKSHKEKELKSLNYSLSRLLSDQETIKNERDLLSVDNEAQKFLLEYNLSRMEVEKLQVKEKIRALRIEMVQLDHQRALKNSQAFNESLGRKRAEFELSKAMRIVRETENTYGGQLGSLRERIMQASDELQRSVEDRSIMQSKLQNAQNRIDLLNEKLREVEGNRLDRHSTEQELKQLRRQLELARETERALNETVNRAESRGDQSRREIMELERELRVLRSENSMLQSKIANKDTLSNFGAGKQAANIKKSAANVSSTPMMIPSISIPTISVPMTSSQPTNSQVPNESPIVRRGKRLSSAKDASNNVVPVPTAVETENTVVPNTIDNSQSNTLTSLLEGVGKKKIKLPERPKLAVGGHLQSQNSQLSQAEIPRSTPMGKAAVDPTVMESIISNFTVKLPTIKK